MRKWLITLLVLVAVPVLAQTKTWNGNSSAIWSVAGNWNPAGVPSSTTNVVFPKTVTANRYTVNLTSGNRQARSVAFGTAALDLTNSYTLSTGTLQLYDGGITNFSSRTNRITSSVTMMAAGTIQNVHRGTGGIRFTIGIFRQNYDLTVNNSGYLEWNIYLSGADSTFTNSGKVYFYDYDSGGFTTRLTGEGQYFAGIGDVGSGGALITESSLSMTNIGNGYYGDTSLQMIVTNGGSFLPEYQGQDSGQDVYAMYSFYDFLVYTNSTVRLGMSNNQSYDSVDLGGTLYMEGSLILDVDETVQVGEIQAGYYWTLFNSAACDIWTPSSVSLSEAAGFEGKFQNCTFSKTSERPKLDPDVFPGWFNGDVWKSTLTADGLTMWVFCYYNENEGIYHVYAYVTQDTGNGFFLVL